MGIYYSFCNCRGGSFCPFLKTTAGHYAFDRLTLKLPLFGKLSRGINAARFASTLSILTRSGVPLVDALKLVLL